MTLFALFCLSNLAVALSGTIIASTDDRISYIKEGIAYFEGTEDEIASKDLYNGPSNPCKLETWQTLECDFVEPDASDPIGGTTPKFLCEFKCNGEKTQVKIKYDQQYNTVWNWGRANPEVYTSVVSQRILWATGFGADQSVPLTVKCKGCPIEPWTYIQAVQGYDSEDVMSGWIDMQLIKSGNWKTKVDEVVFNSTIAYFKLDEYIDGDAIKYLDSNGTEQMGYFWPEMYDYPTTVHSQMVARDALSTIAAFLSYCDNFDGNQGLMCMYDADSKKKVKTGKNDKTTCEGTPLLYIHDTGGTLGYGWNLKHHNFWPNYMDLTQWQEVQTWGDLSKCEVYVNGIPGCSWRGKLKVSEEGRAMAARLLAQITDKQINDVFTAARAQLMRGDSVENWVAGFKDKLNREILSKSCPTAV